MDKLRFLYGEWLDQIILPVAFYSENNSGFFSYLFSRPPGMIYNDLVAGQRLYIYERRHSNEDEVYDNKCLPAFCGELYASFRQPSDALKEPQSAGLD